MPELDLDALQILATLAGHLPYHALPGLHTSDETAWEVVGVDNVAGRNVGLIPEIGAHFARYIAAACNYAPALVVEVQRLRARDEVVRQFVSENAEFRRAGNGEARRHLAERLRKLDPAEGPASEVPAPGPDAITPATRVAAGAALLDRVAPGWYRDVPAGSINMTSDETDVLSLLADAGWYIGAADTHPEDDKNGMTVPVADTAGLTDSDIRCLYDELGQLWAYEVGVRVGRDKGSSREGEWLAWCAELAAGTLSRIMNQVGADADTLRQIAAETYGEIRANWPQDPAAAAAPAAGGPATDQGGAPR